MIKNNSSNLMETVLRKYGALIKYAAYKQSKIYNLGNPTKIYHNCILYVCKNLNVLQEHYKENCSFSTYLYAVVQQHIQNKIGKNCTNNGYHSSISGLIPLQLLQDLGIESVDQSIEQSLYSLDFKSLLIIKMFYYEQRSIVDLMKMLNYSNQYDAISHINHILEMIKENLKLKAECAAN